MPLSECKQGTCEADPFGTVLAGPNDPFFIGADVRRQHPGIETLTIIFEGVAKTTAYHSNGSCIVQYGKSIALSTPFTFVTAGSDVSYGLDVCNAAGISFKEHHKGFATCSINVSGVNCPLASPTGSYSISETSALPGHRMGAASYTPSAKTKASITNASATQRGGVTSNPRVTVASSSTLKAPEQVSSSGPVPTTSIKNLSLVLGVVLPSLAIIILAFCILAWKKRRRAQSWDSSHAKPELPAEEMTAGRATAMNPGWHEKPGGDLRHELGDPDRERIRQNQLNREDHIVSPTSAQELRGQEPAYEMQA